MPTLSPGLKKALSAVLFAVIGALLLGVQQQLVPLAPAGTQPTLIALLAGIAHYLDAWGHKERVSEAAVALDNPPAKRAPSLPPLPLLMLLTLVLACGLPGCSLFGPGGSVWPAVARCAPSAATLVQQVTAILLAGGDYESALLSLAEHEQAGKDAVICAVKEATAALKSDAGYGSDKLAASPARFSAAARGDLFLLHTGNAQ